MNRNETDMLKTIFGRMAEEETLPDGFQSKMMKRILQENARIRKRNERLQWILPVAASLFTAGLAAASLIYLKIPLPRIPFPSISLLEPYLPTGALVLLLLTADYFLREAYYKKHPL
ncbi:MAG: hypothetical protein LBJ23_02065 [Tannerella sp.]|jgi:hypothetical protein|nr:hypothetical protein [Tannerella sp.]